jgi:hypothetical protein
VREVAGSPPPPEEPGKGRRPRCRRGCWTYDSGVGWRLDGTNLVLDFDPLDSGDGAYLLAGDHGGCHHLLEPIDHYLDPAMEWVEQHVDAAVVEPRPAGIA